MNSLTLCCALATLCVDTGWEPAEGGGLVYIIQLEPPLLDLLREGEQITSEVPPEVESVRRYRIVVGDAELPRVGESAHEPSKLAATSGPAPFTLPPTLPPPPDGLDKPLPAPGAAESAGSGISNQRELPSGPPAVTAPKLPAETTRPHDGNAHSTAPQGTQPAGETPTDPARSVPTARKPWYPFLLALTGLFVSMGGNLYLGWVAWDSRRHYHNLLRETGHWEDEQPREEDADEEADEVDED